MRGKTKTEYMHPGIWVLGGVVLCSVMKFIRPTGAVAASDLAVLLLLTLQRGVTSTAHHSVNITCRGVTSPARHAARSHSFVYISTS